MIVNWVIVYGFYCVFFRCRCACVLFFSYLCASFVELYRLCALFLLYRIIVVLCGL